ncbi:MAG: hypothetical protein ABT940_12450 [Alphaproteobacteria bacterium]
MRIGIDFDNTIACYDGVFHAAAVAKALIPADLPTDKASVRNHLRAIDREDEWTALQGYVYGARMDLAACYPGVQAFFQRAQGLGHELFIISHKTRTPYLGPAYDLHEAARGFLVAQGLARYPAHFELTKEAKLERIGALGCGVFIDDLPEFLAEPAFPAATRPLLFDPHDSHADETAFARFSSWAELSVHLLGDG